jgi:hypothetical protein
LGANLLLIAASAALPAATVHFLMGEGDAPIGGKEHLFVMAIGASVAAVASIALMARGLRTRDGRAVVAGGAFATMTLRLAIHGLATPGVLLGRNGVVALARGTALPAGAAILPLAALPAVRCPENVSAIGRALAALLAALAVTGVVVLFEPGAVPSLPKAGDPDAYAFAAVGLALFGVIALRAVRTWSSARSGSASRCTRHCWSRPAAGAGGWATCSSSSASHASASRGPSTPAAAPRHTRRPATCRPSGSWPRRHAGGHASSPTRTWTSSGCTRCGATSCSLSSATPSASAGGSAATTRRLAGRPRDTHPRGRRRLRRARLSPRVPPGVATRGCAGAAARRRGDALGTDTPRGCNANLDLMSDHTHTGRAATQQSLNVLALSATVHCLTGCAIGEVLGMVLATWWGWSDLASILLAVVLAFFFGYLLTSLPLLRAGMAVRQVAPLAFASDTASIGTMEIIDNLFILIIPGALAAGLGDALFWWSLAVGLLIAGFVAYPLNRWLISRGKGHAVTHAHHAH